MDRSYGGSSLALATDQTAMAKKVTAIRLGMDISPENQDGGMELALHKSSTTNGPDLLSACD
jgi:hypothetical protein